MLTEKPLRPRTTVTATFRVSEHVYLALQEEASRQDTSLNTLVNQLFDVHVNEEVYLSKLGYLRVTKPTFHRILEGTADEVIMRAGRSSGDELCKSITLARSGALNRETLLQTLYMFAEFGGFAHYSEIEVQGKPIVVLMHDYGRKGSLFISSFAKAAFEEIGSEPKITTGEQSVIIEF
jgi:hypothetical protein